LDLVYSRVFTYIVHRATNTGCYFHWIPT